MPASVTPPVADPTPAPEVEKKPVPVAEEPDEEPKEKSGGGKGVLIGIGVAVVIAAIVGFLAGGSGGKGGGGGGKPTAAASNADVEALFPTGWTKASAPQIPGMTFASPVAMKPPGGKGGETVVFGQVKEGANNPTLLPVGFLAALGLDGGEVPPREAVQLKRGDLQAYRYKTLRPNGLDDAVTLFTVPTSAGIATLACVDPGGDCEAIADTFKLKAGTAFPVGPSKEYAAAVGKVLGGLDKKVSVRARGAPGREDPEGAGGRGGRSRLGVQGRVGGGLEAGGLTGRRHHERGARRLAQADRHGLQRSRRGGQVGQQERLQQGQDGGAARRAGGREPR